MKYSGKVAYHVNNDPLLFPDLAEFAGIASDNLPDAWIQVLTNGKALTVNKAEALIKAGINELSINYYNNDLNSELPETIRTIRDDLIHRYYNKEQIRRGHQSNGIKKGIFRFNIFRRKETEILTSRAGTSPNKKEKAQTPRGFCEYPFTQFNITVDGRVNKCCADLYFSESMGNVIHESVLDIWRGNRLEVVRRHLYNGDRNAIESCRKCDFYGVKRYPTIIGKCLFLITNN